MSFNTTSCLLLFHAQKYTQANASVLQLCDFTIEISDDLLKWLIEISPRFPNLQKQPLLDLLELNYETRKPYTALFHRAMGLQTPVILDSHTKNNSRIADFNLDLEPQGHLADQYDLITNNGVSEHVFDQRMIFENMHRLCKLGGIFYHKIPMYNVLNAIMYGITPRFYYDLALANQYKILDLRLANRWGDSIPVELEGNQIDHTSEFNTKLPLHPGYIHGVGIEKPKADLAIPQDQIPTDMRLPESISLPEFIKKAPLDNPDSVLTQACNALHKRTSQFRVGNGGEIYATAILQKISNTPFQVPYQGNNLKFIETEEFRQRYQNQIDQTIDKV